MGAWASGPQRLPIGLFLALPEEGVHLEVVNLSNATAGGRWLCLCAGNKTSSALFGLNFGTNLACALRASADMKGACTWEAWPRAWMRPNALRCAALLACLLDCFLAGPRETSDRTIIPSWRHHHSSNLRRRLRPSFPRWTRHRCIVSVRSTDGQMVLRIVHHRPRYLLCANTMQLRPKAKVCESFIKHVGMLTVNRTRPRSRPPNAARFFSSQPTKHSTMFSAHHRSKPCFTIWIAIWITEYSAEIGFVIRCGYDYLRAGGTITCRLSYFPGDAVHCTLK